MPGAQTDPDLEAACKELGIQIYQPRKTAVRQGVVEDGKACLVRNCLTSAGRSYVDRQAACIISVLISNDMMSGMNFKIPA